MMYRLLLIALLLLSCRASGRECSLLHYTREQGLPSNMVYDIYRDSRGFMWIGTDKGAARFDGRSFTCYTTADGLPDNEVFYFLEDRQRRLWLCNYAGALCYYEDGIFHTAANTPFLRLPFASSAIGQLSLERDSSILVIYPAVQKLVRIKGNHCTVHWLPDQWPMNSTVNVHQISDSLYSFFNYYQHQLINIRTGAVQRQRFPCPTYMSHCQDQQYLYDQYYIYSMLRQPLRLLPALLLRTACAYAGDIFIHKIYYDGRDFLTATENGIYLNDAPLWLRGLRTSGISQDIAGNYWIATLGQGIYQADRHFRSNREMAAAPGKRITFACTVRDTVYFATSDRRLYRMEQDRPAFLLDFSEQVPQKRSEAEYSNCAVRGDTIYCIGGNGNLYTYRTDLRRIGKQMIKQPLFARINPEHVRWVAAAPDGLYLCAPSGIVSIPYTYPEGQTGYKDIEHTGGSRIYDIGNDSSGRLWYAKPDGIHTCFRGSSSRQPQLGNRAYKWLHVAGSCLLACTPANTLYLFHSRHGQLRTDSLESGHIIWDRAVTLSADQLLLVSGSRYYTLSLRNAAAGQFFPRIVDYPFVPADADYLLPVRDSCCFFKDGTIRIVSHADLMQQAAAPEVRFSSVTAADSIYHIGEAASGSLNFPYGHAENAKVLFDVLSFNTAGISCEYRIIHDRTDGPAWQPVASQELNLVLPSYGVVDIWVRARSVSGIYGRPRHFLIRIGRPWWAAWWGISLLTLLSLGGILLLVRYRVRRAVRRKEAEHAVEMKILQSEFKAQNALMNPHFIFNTINSVQGLVNEHEGRLASEYIRTFSDMVRQNMQNVSKGLISLSEELSVVVNYLKLEQLRYPNLHFTIDMDPDVDAEDILIPPLLIQPLAENAVKHGLPASPEEAGHISVRVFERQGRLFIEVTDNGSGLRPAGPASEAHTSFALTAIRQRIRAMSLAHHINLSFDIRELREDRRVAGTRAVVSMDYP